MTSSPIAAYTPSQHFERRPRMGAGHWILVVVGSLLALIGLGLTIGGAILLGADAAQQNGRYLVGQTERVRTIGYALTSPSVVIDPGEMGAPGVPPVGELASVHIRATGVVPDQQVFVGIGEAARVEDYLRDVPHASLGDLSWPAAGGRPGGPSWSVQHRQEEVRTTPGNRAPAAPDAQDFWAVSSSGAGAQEISWDLEPGQWSMVVMNADATRPVWVDLQAGARSDLLRPAGIGVLISGLIGLVVGLPLLLLGTAGLGRDIDPNRHRREGPGAALASSAAGSAFSIYPVRFSGFMDRPLSRGLWLVKWLLAIPHYLILALLWFALLVTTIAAGIAILFTGRYPRSWFVFCVGVLRWSWRVGFYSYSALGTDRYPPFTLASADYPADLDVAYPERLSRGLVLVKWWLLAIPHLLVIAAFTSATTSWSTDWQGDPSGAATSSGPSLLGILLLIAAVILLFTGRYREELFAFIVGINRWLYRVWAYVLLMRDEYPPFRLDQGPIDPQPHSAARPVRPVTETPAPEPPNPPLQ